MINLDKKQEEKAFAKYLKNKKDDGETDAKVREYRHPIKYTKFKSKEYQNYGMKHHQQVASLNGMSRKQSFNMLKSLFNDLPVSEKTIFILVISLCIFCLGLAIITDYVDI